MLKNCQIVKYANLHTFGVSNNFILQLNPITIITTNKNVLTFGGSKENF